ncbi:disease resistance protein Pik-2-like [Carex rostrata]
MEAVAISTAKSTLNSVVKTAATAITDEIGLLLGVQEELFFIKEELQMMQGFLRAASTEKVKGVVVSIWVEQVQELAFDVEDCLQEASVYLKKKSCLPVMCSVKKRDHIARKIRVLKTRIEDVSNRNQRYNLINKDDVGHAYDERTSTRSIANVQSLLVGLDKPKRKLVELILKEDGEVISVVGMGGLGKTTLAREVYCCQELRDKFKLFAWFTIQHPFNKEEFIESLAKQIPSNPDDKKYLIVLDDLSSKSEWDKIKDVLPVANGRRIIVTTRYKSPLAETITHPSENIYEIKKLSKKDAFDLFCKAVYKTSNYHLVSNEGPSSTERTEDDIKVQSQFITITISEEEDSKVQEQCTTIPFTKDMDTKARLIIESCGRLPLAIVTIGSYLATKPKTSAEWMKMHNQLSSELTSNPELGVVKTVLTSSYDGMPYHLKPCLLYLSVFHNHKEIRRSRIIRRWVADGYVMADHKKTVEEVAKGYFYDLMGRSLIQPSQMSTIINGDIKRCNIHDMMYELILAKAEDEKLVSVLEDEILITMTDKVRHLVIAGGSYTWEKVQKRVKLSHMRSLSIFGEVGDYLRYPRMKLVRVLDLEGTLNLNNQDLRSIGKLHHLRYLGLRGTKITKLPDSLGKLSELETLDIRNTGVLVLPTGLTKLHKLSYLRAGSNNGFEPRTPILDCLCSIVGYGRIDCCCVLWFLCCSIPVLPCCILEMIEEHKLQRFCYGVRVPRGIGKLRSLNIVGTIDIGGSKSLAKEMKNLTNLHKLAVTRFTRENGKTLGKVIGGLKHLRSLVLKAADDLGLKRCLNSVFFSPPKYLQSLKLYSSLGELPNWISSLENLEKIHFRNTKLKGGTEAIEKLPNLKILYLGGSSFEEELRFGKDTFPMLQVMILEAIDGLQPVSVSIEETALKRLEQLKMRKRLSSIMGRVSGLEFLEQLKEIEMVGDSRSSEFVQNIEEQLKKLPKEPVFRVIEHYLY